MVKTVRDSYGDPVAVVSIPATDLRRGDIIRMASDSLRIEETPILEGARVKIVARSAKEAGGMVRRSYLASKVFDVERAETATHHATKKSPAQLQREIDEVIAARKYPTAPLRDASSLHDVWDPSGKRFKLTYLPYHEKHLYPSYSAYGYGSFEEFFADRAEAKARAQQLRDEERIEKFEIHEIVRPKTGGTSLRLVDEWDDSDGRSRATKKRQRAHATGKSGTGATKSGTAPTATDFSSSDVNGVVAFRGKTVAVRSTRGWTPVDSGPSAVGRAVREAIFSMSDDVAASELRREIMTRL